MTDLPPDPDHDSLEALGLDADAVLRLAGVDRDSGERVTGVVFADHLAEALADARRLRERE
jgi:hypothetical protein